MNLGYFSRDTFLRFTFFCCFVQMMKRSRSCSFSNVKKRCYESPPQCLITVEKHLHGKVFSTFWIQKKIVKGRFTSCLSRQQIYLFRNLIGKISKLFGHFFFPM